MCSWHVVMFTRVWQNFKALQLYTIANFNHIILPNVGVQKLLRIDRLKEQLVHSQSDKCNHGCLWQSIIHSHVVS